MKKNIILSSILASLCGLCSISQAATWTWNPQDGSTDWSQASNWLKDGTPSDSVPQTTTNWGNATISGNYTVTIPSGFISTPSNPDAGFNFYGNPATVTVTDGAQLFVENLTKTQGVNYVIGEGSSMTWSKSVGSIHINSSPLDTVWTIDGTMNVTAKIWWTYTNNKITVNLGSTGILNLHNQDNLGSFNFSASLGNLIAEGAESYQLVTRKLVTGLADSVTSSNTTITDGARTEDISGEALTAENVGKYQVFTQNGEIYVSYINGVGAVPEPATATLGLLGMAALLLRRKRY